MGRWQGELMIDYDAYLRSQYGDDLDGEGVRDDHP